MNRQHSRLWCNEAPLPLYLPPVTASPHSALLCLTPDEIFDNSAVFDANANGSLVDWFCGDVIDAIDEDIVEVCSRPIEARCTTPERVEAPSAVGTPTHTEPDDHWARVLSKMRYDRSPVKQFLHPPTPLTPWRVGAHAECTGPV